MTHIKGKIAEIGKHEELLKKNGYYASYIKTNNILKEKKC